MTSETITETVSIIVAASALWFGIFQYQERRRQQLLIDLQGHKEAVAAAADRIRRSEPPSRFRWLARRHRKDQIRALCLATVFEKSGRSRALIYAALTKTLKQDLYRTEIEDIVESLSDVIKKYSGFTDLKEAEENLDELRAAVGLKSDH